MPRRGRARIGCSGWVYKDWRGIVYPEKLPQRRWFEFYSEHFDTVEINNSFYRLPSPEMADHWGAQAPPGFVYAAKLGQFGSHRMKLRDAASWLPNHLDRVRRLGPAMGPTLVQLPPRWKRNVERLDEFLTTAVEQAPEVRWAVELRDPTWAHDDVYETLRRHGAALCIHDLLEDHPWIRTTDWTYVRFHGSETMTRKYYGLYGSERLEPVARRLEAWMDEGCDVYGYFNNDWEGFAPRDAAWLRDRLGLQDGDAAGGVAVGVAVRGRGEHRAVEDAAGGRDADGAGVGVDDR
jgi:uncharacterized protein YecE (DUF72 family)